MATKKGNVQTLLAKALYDNVADAPDELTFRKGDIVTVLEQDVDGLTGWWLCLLHGDQGIVPGNRLGIIPPDDLAALEKDTDGHNDDLPVEDLSTMYDFLPNSDNINQIKPLVSDGNEVLNIPSIELIHPEEIYDIPKSDCFIEDKLYDTPRFGLKNVQDDIPQRIILDEVYDIPTLDYNKNLLKDIDTTDVLPINFDGLDIYDDPVKIETASRSFFVQNTTRDNNTPKNNHSVHRVNYFGSDSPRNTVISKDGVDPNTMGIAKADSQLEIDKLMGEIYDSPFSGDPTISTVKRSPNSSKSSTPRHSMSIMKKTIHGNTYTRSSEDEDDIYDLPSQVQNHSEDIYDKPVNKNLNDQNSCFEFQRNEKTEKRNVLQEEIYDIPVFSRTKITKFTSGQIKSSNQDAPGSNLDMFFEPTLIGSLNDGVKGAEIYDTPPSMRQSDVSNTQFTGPYIYNTPVHQELNDPPMFVMPKNSHSEQVISESQNNYDKPTLNHEMHDTSLIKHGAQIIQERATMREEVYDTLPSRQDIYMTVPSIHQKSQANQIVFNAPPISSTILATREQVYDVPNKNAGQTGKIKDLREAFINIAEPPPEDIYDNPASHDLKKVMSEVQKNAKNTVTSSPSDDYVDYHDVWSEEPCYVLLDDRSPIQSLSAEYDGQKKSILDQINFDLVKELEITSSEALEQLRKLHLAVDTCVQTLLSFWSENWLEIRILKQTIRSIRDFSSKLKTSLRLLTEFGLSTLINCTKVPRGEALMDKLIIEVEPLLESYYKIKICLLHLENNNWQVPDIRNIQTEKFFATLNAIMILSERLPELCKAFNLGVQNKVHELFPSNSNDLKHLTPLLSFQPAAIPRSTPIDFNKQAGFETDAGTLRREMADRRQQARDSMVTRPVPLVPPKPSLPNPEERKSLSGSLQIPDSPRVFELSNRAFEDAAEGLVTDYLPEDHRHKKYASDPTKPLLSDRQENVGNIHGGSCPMLNHHLARLTPYVGESPLSSASSVSAGIPEDTIEIKQTATSCVDRKNKNNSKADPNIDTRSAPLPWDGRLRNNNSDDDRILNPPTLLPLDHRDVESLEFFCRQVESQVVLLRESMKNLTEAVENNEEPVIFVQHAKFISLTGHRVFHSGQEISERLTNNDIKVKLKDDTAHLTLCIRGVVAATKTAALEYPNAASMMEMISSVLALGDAVRIIYSVCRKALDS